jgi:prepilin-type processing-associated H-X9-DG protein
VVIGIIALLIAILLPALGKARQAAKTVSCSANLRSIVQAMQIYASQNGGSIPGSPWTSSRLIYSNLDTATVATGISDDNLPGLIQSFDWATPIARLMNAKFEEGGSRAQRVERYEYLRDYPAFRCPENELLGTPFGSVAFKVGRLVSYNTALLFMFTRNKTGVGGPSGYTVAFDLWNPPSGYNVKTSKVGDASKKVYIADGARYSNCGTPPDADLGITSQLGGAFSDQGPWSRFSNSWDRGRAPGNTPRVAGDGRIDARIYAFRHGGRGHGAKADTYRINLAFFDGHVETMGDLQASNPVYWMPKGTELTVSSGNQQYKDVVDKYLTGMSGKYIVP